MGFIQFSIFSNCTGTRVRYPYSTVQYPGTVHVLYSTVRVDSVPGTVIHAPGFPGAGTVPETGKTKKKQLLKVRTPEKSCLPCILALERVLSETRLLWSEKFASTVQ